MIRSKERYHAWERTPNESEKDFKRRLSSEYKRQERNMEKIMRFRAWEQMPGESSQDFKRRLKSEIRRTNPF